MPEVVKLYDNSVSIRRSHSSSFILLPCGLLLPRLLSNTFSKWQRTHVAPHDKPLVAASDEVLSAFGFVVLIVARFVVLTILLFVVLFVPFFVTILCFIVVFIVRRVSGLGVESSNDLFDLCPCLYDRLHDLTDLLKQFILAVLLRLAPLLNHDLNRMLELTIQ